MRRLILGFVVAASLAAGVAAVQNPGFFIPCGWTTWPIC